MVFHWCRFLTDLIMVTIDHDLEVITHETALPTWHHEDKEPVDQSKINLLPVIAWNLSFVKLKIHPVSSQTLAFMPVASVHLGFPLLSSHWRQKGRREEVPRDRESTVAYILCAKLNKLAMNSCYLLKWPAFILSPWTRGLIASACCSCQPFWLGCQFRLSIYHDKHNYLNISFYGFYKSPGAQSMPSDHQLQPRSAGSTSTWLLRLCQPLRVEKMVFNVTVAESLFHVFKLR